MSNSGHAATVDPLAANKALIRRVYSEWWNANGDVGSVDEMVRSDFIGHMGDGKIRTIENLKDDIFVYQSALGGLREVVNDLIAEGDKVAVRYTLYATHTGDFRGIKATGRKIEVNGIEIFRIEEGKIVEFWHFGESMDLS